NGAKARARRRRVERPRRQPVHAAHVTAEERRHGAQSVGGDQLHHAFEPPEHRAIEPSRFGLEVGPAEEEAYAVETELRDAGKIVGDLTRVETLPHVHRAPAWPVVDP